jgi:hypothetical protein
MAFIEGGAAGEFEAADRRRLGYVANYTKVFGQRPEVYLAWQQLAAAISGGMELRHYELATLSAAAVMRSSYCSLAHGKILSERFLGPEATRAVVGGAPDGVLDEQDAEIVRLRGGRPRTRRRSPRRTSRGCGRWGCPTVTSST